MPNLSISSDPFMDTDEAAAMLGVHPKTLQRLARSGRITAYRVGKLWRFKACDLWADVAALGTQTRGAAKLLRRPCGLLDPRFDAQIELELEGQKFRLLAKFKNVDRRLAIAPIKELLDGAIKDQFPGHLQFLVAPYMTEAMYEECRRIDLSFADTAGNLFIRTGTMLLCIVGRRRPHHLERSQKGLTPAGMKVIFALLCRPELAGTGYRQIATAAQVALGAVGPVFQDLESRGFLRRQRGGSTALERPEELLHEWVVEYPAILRPRLHGRHYQADPNRVLGLNLKPIGAYWGGEVAAERKAKYPKAEHLLIYTRGQVKELLIQGRMSLTVGGNIEVLEAFWHPEVDQTETSFTPPLLVYADLIQTGNIRHFDTASRFYEEYLQRKPLRTDL